MECGWGFGGVGGGEENIHNTCVCVHFNLCDTMTTISVHLPFCTTREINILKKLQHKNVIELVEVFEDHEKQKLYPLNLLDK